MSSEATEMQIERYRKMTCEERITIGLEMTHRWLEGLKEQIRREHPNADDIEFKRLLRRRIEMAKET